MHLLTCFFDKRDWLAESRDNLLAVTSVIKCHFRVATLETKQNLKHIVKKWNEQASIHFAAFCQRWAVFQIAYMYLKYIFEIQNTKSIIFSSTLLANTAQSPQ